MQKKVLVFGGSGLVGSKFIELQNHAFSVQAPTTLEVDILNKDQVSKEIEDFNPDTIINFAAYTQVEEAESQNGNKEGLAYKINAIGAKNVADACKSFDRHLIHISTEYVFDGTKENSPYVEADIPNPINWYGKTKFFGEEYVLESRCKATIVRISMPYSSFYELKKDIARFFLGQLKLGNKVSAVSDQQITPTLVNNIANALKIITENQSLGIYHVSCTDPLTPLDFVKTIAKTFKLDYSLISGVSLEEFNKNKKAKFLKNSSLNPAKFEKDFGEGILHTVEESVSFFKKAVDGLDSN